MPSNTRILGINPVRIVLLPFLLLFFLGLLVLLLLGFAHLVFGGIGLLVLGAILTGIWIYMMIDQFSDVISAYSNAAMFRASCRQVRAGRISPDWILRDDSCDGLLAMDEKAQLVMANARIHPFTDVILVQQRLSSIELTIRGEDEVVVISLDGIVEAEEGSIRVVSSLGADPVSA